MLTLPSSVRVDLALDPSDMRRGHDGPVSVVRSVGELDPCSRHLFVFLERRRDRAKLLHRHRGDFVLVDERLEHGRFEITELRSGQTRAGIDSVQRAMHLDGIDVGRVARGRAWSPPTRIDRATEVWAALPPRARKAPGPGHVD